MLELTPNDPIIKTYIEDLQHLKDHQVVHELGLKGLFQNLLAASHEDEAERGMTINPDGIGSSN